jgi:hypothetical protein
MSMLASCRHCSKISRLTQRSPSGDGVVMLLSSTPCAMTVLVHKRATSAVDVVHFSIVFS